MRKCSTMTRLTKKDMVDALMAAGVEVRQSYTIAQLLPLYNELGAAATTESDAFEKTNPSETPANDVIPSETNANFEKPSEMAADASENRTKKTSETFETASEMNLNSEEISETKINEKIIKTSAAKKNKTNVMNEAYKWPNFDDGQGTRDVGDDPVQQNINNIDDDDVESVYSEARSEEVRDEIAYLREQRVLLRLRREVREMQREEAAISAATIPVASAAVPTVAKAPAVPASAVVVANTSHRRIDFSDIEYSIPNFSGDDRGHDVRDFLRVFEEVMTLTQADETFKSLALRRKLKGAANCLMYTTEAVNYDGLKALLVEEFGDRMTVAEAERLLRRRLWKKSEETLHYYVLEMQKLRRRLDTNRFTEAEFVDLIIDGLALPIENTNILRGTNTVRELKRLLDRYEAIINYSNIS